ncbi:unnamed protein product [Dovyalis caffra]|uniref:Uncharacterized protein n=1 Tax=Dovyalis caffra TaxID=77055 RepID=A0AAV1RJH4_9ROSI|nr:unnamed protein product [Dovyalis caffra]
MLPKGIGDIEKAYQDTCQDLELLGRCIATGKKALSKKDVVDTMLADVESYATIDSDFQCYWRTTKSVLDGGYRLAKQLRSLEFAKRWEMINEVWIEMLAHAAAHCPWKERAQQLRRGGELLTHEEQRQCVLAIGRYELGNADISLSIADEEVKELQRVAANKERELEHKNEELERKDRELEHLRSLLAASTQPQRLDALPGGSSAQSDNQGTGDKIILSVQ